MCFSIQLKQGQKCHIIIICAIASPKEAAFSLPPPAPLSAHQEKEYKLC